MFAKAGARGVGMLTEMVMQMSCWASHMVGERSNVARYVQDGGNAEDLRGPDKSAVRMEG